MELLKNHVRVMEAISVSDEYASNHIKGDNAIILELYKDDQIFLSNLATCTTLIVLLVWSLFLKNIVYDVGWLEVKEWWLVTLEKPFQGFI